MITYEFPFNERIRMLLRLEDLYEKFQFFLQQEHPLQHHVALTTIFEILEVIGRQDLKGDLLQDLERQKQILQGFRTHPDVQVSVLDTVLANIGRASAALLAPQGRTGQAIRDNEWLMSVRGRTIIPGGACEFDLPSYYAWKNKPSEERFSDIENWFRPLVALFDAINVILGIVRDSGTTTENIAQSGTFQQMLHGKIYQLLRIELDQKLGVIPETSANKYMLSVRFTLQEGGVVKPKPTTEDVPFKVTLC